MAEKGIVEAGIVPQWYCEALFSISSTHKGLIRNFSLKGLV